MHPLFEKASALTETIIASAIEVHRDKGPGLIESIYEWCLTKELGLRGVNCVSQKVVVVEYKGFTREEPLSIPVGLLINFHEMKVTDGIRRLILSGANQ
jgi:PD-(D/E)XK nuclease superfamily